MSVQMGTVKNVSLSLVYTVPKKLERIPFLKPQFPGLLIVHKNKKMLYPFQPKKEFINFSPMQHQFQRVTKLRLTVCASCRLEYADTEVKCESQLWCLWYFGSTHMKVMIDFLNASNFVYFYLIIQEVFVKI